MPDSVSTFDSDPNQPQVTNLSHSDADLIQAELVRMHQSDAQEIDTDEVELNVSAALNIKAQTATAHETIIGVMNAGEVSLTNSGVAAIRAETANVNGAVGAVVAGSANLGNTYAGVIAAREVRGERIETLVLLSGKVEGQVSTMFDARNALIAGLVGGLFGGLIFLLGRMLLRRD